MHVYFTTKTHGEHYWEHIKIYFVQCIVLFSHLMRNILVLCVMLNSWILSLCIVSSSLSSRDNNLNSILYHQTKQLKIVSWSIDAMLQYERVYIQAYTCVHGHCAHHSIIISVLSYYTIPISHKYRKGQKHACNCTVRSNGVTQSLINQKLINKNSFVVLSDRRIVVKTSCKQ